jgi:transcriptional regulator with XRE-family HTH domain
MATLKVPHQVGDLGGYLKEQRETARLSLRQLASVAGVSNPYLSQIERGLRKPSAEVLQQIAKGLQISAEALFLRAGLLEESGGLEVEVALQSDVNLTARQKRVLLDIYGTFRAENGRLEPVSGEMVTEAVEAAIEQVLPDEPGADEPDAEPPRARRPRRSSAAKKTRAAKKAAAQEEPDEDVPVIALIEGEVEAPKVTAKRGSRATARKTAGRAPRKRTPRKNTDGDAAAGAQG